jgi:hypothetical protein
VAYHRHPQPRPNGEPTLLEVETWPTSITLAPGSRCGWSWSATTTT